MEILFLPQSAVVLFLLYYKNKVIRLPVYVHQPYNISLTIAEFVTICQLSELCLTQLNLLH